jgi:hypothetical protein
MNLEDHVIHLENGRLTGDTTHEVVNRIARRAVQETGDGGIVIHFHGGLVSCGSGIEIAERLHPRYSQANAYPVFFVWESDVFETLENNLQEIAHEFFYERLWKRLSEFIMRKFSQTGRQRVLYALPEADPRDVCEAFDQIQIEGKPESLEALAPTAPSDLSELSDHERLILENELLQDSALMEAIRRVSDGLRTPGDVALDLQTQTRRVQGSTETLMDYRSLDRLTHRPAPAERGILDMAGFVKAAVTIAGRVISRFVHHRDHGFHATLVEEILRGFYLANVGEFIWTVMKKDPADSFGDDAAIFGGTAFLEALREAMDPTRPTRITLVGHSTGAVYISEFLDKATSVLPATVRYGIVFLAPASTFEKTAATLERHTDLISGFRMFTMTDANERRDRLVPVIYPHSLLYFVSGVVEPVADTPIVGMERYYDDLYYPGDTFPAVRTVRDFILGADDRAVWSVTEEGPQGLRSASLRHGDFDNDSVTLDSVAHILAGEF